MTLTVRMYLLYTIVECRPGAHHAVRGGRRGSPSGGGRVRPPDRRAGGSPYREGQTHW